MNKLVAFALAALLPGVALAQEKVTGTNADLRTYLWFKAPDAVLAKLLPPGWAANPPASGPTRGANLNISLIEQVNSQDAEGKPVATFRGAAIFIYAKKTGSDAGGPMVVAGLFSPNGAPGAYGVYLPAKVAIDRRLGTDSDGKTTIDETWDLRSDDGNALQAQLQFVRGTVTRSKTQANVYSGAKPDFFRIYRVEIAADVARSIPAGVDRVARFSFKASGQKLAPMFDSAELVAITSAPWYSRQVSLPGL